MNLKPIIKIHLHRNGALGEMDSKIICFYLPQYYEFEENNRWWGKGFTEWTNVRNAKPLYKGHYQPTVPLDRNYYCLEDIETFRWQARLAKKYNIYGFCFYEYYFGNGKYLMEKPLEIFLKNKDIDIHFCLCWANHTWSRTWTGEEKDILMAVNYDEPKQLKQYFNYLLRFFKDERYIKIDNKPLFVIYVPEQIPNLKIYKELFNKWTKDAGYNGIIFVSQNTEVALNRCKYREYVDYSIVYEPNYSLRRFRDLLSEKQFIQAAKEYPRMFADKVRKRIIRKFFSKKREAALLNTVDYDCIWKNILKRDYSQGLWPCGFVNVDTTPRKGYAGIVTKWNSPQKFGKYLKQLILKCQQQPFIFLMAWNEWGEGAYLEPDEKNKYRYLEEIRNAIEQSDSLSGN